MPKEFSRSDRIAASVRKILAQPLNDLVLESNAGLVTMGDVKVSPDLKKATVFVTVYGERSTWAALENHLEQHAYVLQNILSRELRSKRTPVLSFRIDDTLEQTDRINKLIFENSDK